MAVYKIFPLQDSTLYSFYPSMNTGIDPLIEAFNINVNYNPVAQTSRFLVKFDNGELEDVINNKVSGSSFESTLKVFIAEAQGIIMESELEIYPISGSWDNGSGTYLDSPFTENGVSWVWRTFVDDTRWLPTGSLSTYVDAYYSGSIGGGNWFTGSSDILNTNIKVTQSFSLRSSKDLKINVTDIINVWYSSSNSIGGNTKILNEGFLIKWEDVLEFNSTISLQPVLQFYAVDTHTIYPPVLEIKWDDSSYITGSLSVISTSELFIGLNENPGIFFSESINRFRLNVRPKYPNRVFQTSSIFTDNFCLPETSYYAIKDLDTNEYVIDFDNNFTKVSCDSEGGYFDIYMNGLQPERYYKIIIKTLINGNTLIRDDNYYFKIING